MERRAEGSCSGVTGEGRWSRRDESQLAESWPERIVRLDWLCGALTFGYVAIIIIENQKWCVVGV